MNTKQAFKHGLLIARREVVEYIEARGFSVCDVIEGVLDKEYEFLIGNESGTYVLSVQLGVLQINHNFEERSNREGRFSLTGTGVQVVKVLGLR